MTLEPAEIQGRMVLGFALLLVLAVIGLTVYLGGGAPGALQAVLDTLEGDGRPASGADPAHPAAAAPEAQHLHYRTVFTDIGMSRPRPRPQAAPGAPDLRDEEPHHGRVSADAAPLLRPTF